MAGLQFARAQLKTTDTGFSDVWYPMTNQTGDELTAPQAYAHVGIVGRAVDILANAGAGIPYDIVRGERVVTERYTPMKWSDLFNQALSDFAIFGAYYYKPEDVGGRIGLKRFLPSTIQWHYRQGVLYEFTRSTAVGTERYKPEELIWMWEQNAESEYGPGKSLLFKALVDANIINAGGRFAQAWYLRGGPLTLLRGPANLKEGERTKVENWWNKARQGFSKWFKGLLIAADMLEPILFGGDMKSAENEKTIRAAEERAVASIGIPLSIIYANSATLATGEQDERNLINYAAEPLAKRCIQPFNEKLFMPQGVLYELHKNRMSAFSTTSLQLTDTVVKAIDGGLITTAYAQEHILQVPITPRRVKVESSTPAPQFGDATTTPPTPQRVEIPAQTQAAQNDKAAWYRKAINAMKRGQSPAVTFTSDAIGAIEHARITTALVGCVTAEDVKAVFDNKPVDELKRANDLLERALVMIGDGK